MSDSRLPAHLEVAGLIRATQAAGGFATVIYRGERDAGVILLLTMEKGTNARLWERMPRADGKHEFTVIRLQDAEKQEEFEDYLTRRRHSDGDMWLLELDVPNAERLVAEFAR